MIADKMKELKELEGRASQLKTAIEQERAKELAALPARFGYSSTDQFILAVRKVAPISGKRRRISITPEMKTKVRELIETRHTGREIAEILHISTPSVHNIKKELGLVKERHKVA